MKSLFFIAAVALLSQVRLSAGISSDLLGSLLGGGVGIRARGGFGGGDAGLSKETGTSTAYYVIGFINSNTDFCTKLASVESCQKKTTGLNLLGVVDILPGTTYIDLSITIRAEVDGAWQEFSCTAVVSSKDAAYTLAQYKCPLLGIEFPAGYKK